MEALKHIQGKEKKGSFKKCIWKLDIQICGIREPSLHYGMYFSI